MVLDLISKGVFRHILKHKTATMHNASFKHSIVFLDYLRGCSVRVLEWLFFLVLMTVLLEYIILALGYNRGIHYSMHLKLAFSALHTVASYTPFMLSCIICLLKKWLLRKGLNPSNHLGHGPELLGNSYYAWSTLCRWFFL